MNGLIIAIIESLCRVRMKRKRDFGPLKLRRPKSLSHLEIS